jgi:hypothetical protein
MKVICEHLDSAPIFFSFLEESLQTSFRMWCTVHFDYILHMALK